MSQQIGDTKRFSVEITGYSASSYTEVVQFLSRNFKIDTRKAVALLQNLPKVITKPLKEEQANKILMRLQSVNIDARLAIQGSHTKQHNVTSVSPVPSITNGVDVDISVGLTDGESDIGESTQAGEVSYPIESSLVENSSGVIDNIEDISDDFDDFDGTDDEATANFSGPPVFSGPPIENGVAFSGPSTDPPSSLLTDSSRSTKDTMIEEGFDGESKESTTKKRRRTTILRKLLNAIVIPSLLSIAGVISAIFLVVSPALLSQLFGSARQPAETIVRNLSYTLRNSNNTVDVNVANIRDQERLKAVQREIAEARNFIGGGSIAFTLATDPQGNYISGWFEHPEDFFVDALTPRLREVAPQLLHQEEVDFVFDDVYGTKLDIVALRLSGPDGSLGGLFVGIDDSSRQKQVRRILLTTLVIVLLPLIFAIIWGVVLGRAVTRNIRTLATAADDLSRGNLDANVQVDSNDEIADLGDAFERLRTSLRVAFERMRTRRKS